MLSFSSSLRDTDFISGALLLVDKPKGWTSFDAVNKIKNLIRRKYDLRKFKIGHSGTLDPMATGLLLVCTGGWTKKLHFLQGLDKKYMAEITLGIETNTYDAEGEIVAQKEIPSIALMDLHKIINSYVGEFHQVPPAFSAIKKEGKPLYALARAGKEVLPEPRLVTLHDAKLLAYQHDKLTLDIHCGSGFYVRSLAHDLGAALGSGAHLSALCRTEINDYHLKDAFSIEAIIEYFNGRNE